MDVGGVEYLVSSRHGRHYFYDVNALSNFVADASNVIGFNPYVNLADLIVQRAAIATAPNRRPSGSLKSTAVFAAVVRLTGARVHHQRH